MKGLEHILFLFNCKRKGVRIQSEYVQKKETEPLATCSATPKGIREGEMVATSGAVLYVAMSQ